jgi:hypothetical protein
MFINRNDYCLPGPTPVGSRCQYRPWQRMPGWHGKAVLEKAGRNAWDAMLIRGKRHSFGRNS